MRVYVVTYSPTENGFTVDTLRRSSIVKAANVADACKKIIDENNGRNITVHYIYREDIDI